MNGEKKERKKKKNNWKKARSITIDAIHVYSKNIFTLLVRYNMLNIIKSC